MADQTQQFANQVQDLTRFISAALQGMAEMQFNVLHRLAEVQRTQLSQVANAVTNQLQLISTTRDPGQFTGAQTDLVMTYGHQYAESMKEAADIVVQAWQEYGNQLAKTTSVFAGETQRAVRTAAGKTEKGEASSRTGKPFKKT
jgi:hypothetical protein